MRVNGLDHVNICTQDVVASAQFYAELLGLDIRNAPAPLPPDQFLWLYDANDRPIIHLRKLESEGTSTGPIHHVALHCSGIAEMKERLQARGAEFGVNEMTSIGLTQIFTRDPHGILLELNFFEE